MRKLISKKIIVVFCCSIPLLSTGCSSSKNVQGSDFELVSVVKNDIDLVTEMHQSVVFKALEDLATKLYKRNPKEWKKQGYDTLELAVEAIVVDPFPKVEGKSGVECIRMAFDENYQGDRVKAFVVGLETMVLASYDGRRSFYLLNMLEAQPLYNSARNIELASWLLRTRYKQNGELFLLSTNGSEQINLSFERLFGKMINAQDMLAQVMADRNHRQIKNVLQSLATAFIPIL